MSRVGYSSNHGMTTTDSKQEILKQEADLVKKNKGHVVACPYCGENFHFSKQVYSSGDAARLLSYLTIKKCPWCKEEEVEVNGVKTIIQGWKQLMDFCQVSGRLNPVVKHFFLLPNGLEIETIRKPEGWKGIRKAVDIKK